MKRISFLFLLLIYFVTVATIASAQKNFAQRYEIDAKRIGVLPADKDALPRSREFLRLDSTYYVGWMYEGIYKSERSSDYLGYKNAIHPLQKAFDLIDKDFGKTFRKLYSSPIFYMDNQSRFNDLYEITGYLLECYNNVEMPDSVMSILDKVESYHFQKDFFGVNYERAWTYHRNRFFTSEKYDFLKNSVEENEKVAYQNCYKGFQFIQKNQSVNDYWYGPHQSEDDRLSIYHYLAILHNYNQKYDSAEYYYKKLEEGHRILWGNYAGMQVEIGNFDKGIEYFMKSRTLREHGLDETYYFVPTLYIYGGRTKEAINMENKKIAESGSTPGFGWYTIALARSYLYDGQLDSCEFFLTKAANFKELHIGTTLTQSQYEFTINLLKVQLADKKAAEIKFLNKGWWYSFTDLYNFISCKIEKYLNVYVVVNEMANNPERKRIVYDLFCDESTVSFDETMYLLKDFSNSYFQNKYEDYQLKDKRQKIQRYFKLFCAKLKYENGDRREAASLAENLLKQSFSTLYTSEDLKGVLVDTSTEKLFLARLYEVLAKSYENEDDQTKFNISRNNYFDEFPQLLPFSGIKLQMNISVSGENDETISSVMKDLKACNIDWTDEKNNCPQAEIKFTKKGKLYEAIINVKSASGKTMVSDEQMVFKNTIGTGKELALRLFGKGGVIEFESIPSVH